ncbi:helix-turn-helix transcriptional regulator [Bogoriella caseilytica]|uniref:Putative transcriptional regulator n=1 Tax=Bogoriella caseilytica TaxID=56055 RepID=A0A3N2BFY9_9MICO|nr:helix-turn-helix transcriptional regulator [Bogoriella caseilytica]ROR74157.1 putative transcriptional regulator [Bogoriella caseilytica]
MENTLAQLRNQHGITQDELARLAEVSRQTIISIEKGRYEPRLALAFRLARIFSCRVEDLFIPTDER